MKRKIISILLTLVLVLGMSLVTAVPAMAAAPTAELTPADEATNVALDATVQAVFSESVTVVTNLDGVTIAPDPGGVVATLEADAVTLSIAHDDFDNGEAYTVTIPADTVQNGALEGNAVITWTFITVQETIDLGTAANYAILSKTGVTTTGTTLVTGNIGASPIDSTAITGFALEMDETNTFSTSSLVVGKVYAADYTDPTPANLTTAVSDMETAYTTAAGRTNPNATELYAGDLSGQTLSPGLYKWGTGVLVNTSVTLDAGGDASAVWIFQIAEDLTFGSGAEVVLAGGAQASNIFWQVEHISTPIGVTIGTDAHVEGNILALGAIAMNTGASLSGRALSQTEVTLIANAVTAPTPISFIVEGITSPITAGTPSDVTVTVMENGAPKTDYEGTITFTSTDPQVVLPSPYTFVPGDEGVHTFIGELTFKTAGIAQKVAVSDTDDNVGTSANIVVNPAEAAGIALSVDDDSITAGADATFTVNTLDAYGNVVEDVSTAEGTTYDIDLEAGGSWAINVYTSENAGTWDVTATYGEWADTLSLTVTAGDAATMSIVDEPGETVAGEAIGPVTVLVLDEFDNPVADVDVTVDDTDLDDGTFMQTTDAEGIATFDDLVINTAGTYQLVFSAAGVDDATSQEFEIVPAAFDAGASTVEVDTTEVTAGDTVAVTVTPKDAFGNLLGAGKTVVVLLDGDATGITVTDVGDGTYTADVQVTSTTADNVISTTVGGDAITQTQTITVNPAAASYFEFDEIDPQEVDTAFDITITAYDEYGNVDTNYVSTAILSDLTGTINPTSSEAFTAGTKTVSVTITQAIQDNVITATDGEITGDSGAFNVADLLIDLNEDGWTLISTDKPVTTGTDWVGVTLALKYTPSGAFVEAEPTDLEPLTAIYVKTAEGGGVVGIIYAEDAGPGIYSKELEAGWNLISTHSDEIPANDLLSTLRYATIGTQQGVALSTLVSQGAYNQNTDSFYEATLTDADWDDALTMLLSPFDGYWAYMNAAKTFEVIPD